MPFILIITAGVYIYYGFDEIIYTSVQEPTMQVVATVIEKEFNEGTKILPILTGKVVVPVIVRQPDYYVLVLYNGEKLYNSVKVGDTVKLNLYLKRNGKYELKYQPKA